MKRRPDVVPDMLVICVAFTVVLITGILVADCSDQDRCWGHGGRVVPVGHGWRCEQ